MRKIQLLFIACLVLFGCATDKTLDIEEGTPTAAIVDTYKNITLTSLYFFEVTHVNGTEILSSSENTRIRSSGLGLLSTAAVASRDVPAGNVELSIRGIMSYSSSITGVGKKDFEFSSTTTVSLKENETYIVKGEYSTELIKLWLMDRTGAEVSPVFEFVPDVE